MENYNKIQTYINEIYDVAIKRIEEERELERKKRGEIKKYDLFTRYYLDIAQENDSYSRYFKLTTLRDELQDKMIYSSIIFVGLHKLYDFNDFEEGFRDFLYLFFTNFCPKNLLLLQDDARNLLKSYSSAYSKNQLSEELMTNLINFTKHQVIMLKHFNILIHNYSKNNLDNYKDFILTSISKDFILSSIWFTTYPCFHIFSGSDLEKRWDDFINIFLERTSC